MRQPTWMSVAVAALLGLLPAVAAEADVFNMPGGQTSLEFVPVGNPGNANDPDTGFGSVAEPYLIGKFEITNAQWREFLTAKASTSDPYGLYNTDMAGTYGGIDRTWSVDHYVYTAKGGDANWDNRPANFVSFWDAARFCNWLHNGQGDGDTETGAYLNIGQTTFARQPGAKYFIPTENEWYKAAYFDPLKSGGPGYWDYPTKSDAPPINTLIDPDPGNHANFYDHYGTGNGGFTLGSPYYSTLVGDFENSGSAFGTFDQGGNLQEWTESAATGSGSFAAWGAWRGGTWNAYSDGLLASFRGLDFPTSERSYVGFRVASVPEPGSITMLLCAAIGGLLWWRRRR
jgi:sulfatase modifying factor 1